MKHPNILYFFKDRENCNPFSIFNFQFSILSPMKKLLIYITTALTLMSCNDFLDTESLDNLPADKPYSSPEEVFGGLTSVYQMLADQGTYGYSLWNNFECGTDLLAINRSYTLTGLRIYIFNNSDADLAKTWIALYKGIGNANYFLDQMIVTDSTACGGHRAKEAYIGEAKALRAIYYLNLISIWGDVPFRTEASYNLNNTQMPRTPQADILEQLVLDLQYAAEKCYSYKELMSPGRISQTAAQALLARTYMYLCGYPNNQDKWQEMYNAAQAVETSGIHRLNQNGYEDVFIKLCSDKYDMAYNENILEVEFYGNNMGGYMMAGNLGASIGIQQTSTTAKGDSLGYAYAFLDGTKRLNELYGGRTSTDVRRNWNIATYIYTNDLKAYHTKEDGNAAKWRREYETVFPKGKNNTPNNFPLVRYAEVLLMLAEASHELGNGQALGYLNQVRERSRATTFSEGELSDSQLKQEIRDERARELCYECLRRADLRRWGKNVYFETIRSLRGYYTSENPQGRAAYNIADKHLYYPIPEVETSVNKAITQNPGW